MGLSEAISKASPGSSWNPLNWAPSLPSPSKISLPGVSSLPGLSSLPGASLFGTKDQAWFKSVLTKFGLSGVLATVFSFFLYAAYLKFVKKDDKGALDLLKDKVSEYVNKIPGIGMLRKVPLLEKLIPSSESLIHVPKGTQSALSSISGIAPGIASKLNPAKWKIFNKKKIAEQEDDENYQAGEPYGDPTAMATGIATDLKSMGLKAGFKDLRTLFEVAKTKGKPINDRDMTMEKMIAIAASLPRTSKARGKLTGTIIDTLWKSLQHPPLSYMGNKFQYRTPDGSYNNPLQPDLGKAGSPYARTVPKMKHLHGVPPDPGLLFDLLMARSDDTFKENPAGISSVLFYHATIIIHDCFRTNRVDPSISDTSSYLDLAPLYGSNLKDQLSIRTMQRGLLKPDSFAEKRLLGQPPGVNVMLVMYSRFHNYVADVLLNINENGRFTLRPTKTEEDKKAALAQQDEDIFQTARLVTNGLYINISLHDYLRGLTNTHHSASDWTLDPRIEVGRMFDPEGVPRGIGNQVSAEFNLLYRFHSVISQRDEKWTNQFMQKIFPHKPLDQLTPQDFVEGLLRFEQSIPEDPAERTFDGLKRGANGRFDDAELVNIMKESMEDPAGLFNARMVPKALRMIEISGIMTSRKWNLASLNEMRSFFGLKRHATFEDINPDPQIADLMRKFYDHPDMVEMYPGLFLEDGKPRMDPGCGGCPPYTVGRAVFSDAVSLVRSDRFLTVDYTPSNLTAWGYQEVQQDYDILGGSMFWKLFQRAFPGWFPYNSLHSTQPMFTRKMNEQIAREIGTIDQYTFQDPSPPLTPNIATKYSAVTKILSDQKNFRVIWAKNLNDMTPGKKYDSYMLGGDAAANTAQRNLVKEIMFSPPEFMQLLSQTSMHVAKELLDDETLSLGKDLNQIDIIRDIAIPLNTRIMADLFCLDLKTDENKGGSLNSTELYTYLMSVRTFGFNNFDPALALRRRREAHEGSKVLTETTLKVISGGSNPVSDAQGIVSKATGDITGAVTSITSKIPFVGGLFSKASKKAEAKVKTGSLRWYGQNVVKELISAGKSPEEAADICWLTAVAGVGAPIGMFADVLNYFLQEENSQHWEAIQNLSSSSDPESADKELRKYVLEAQRLTSNQRDIRACVSETTVDGKTYKPGDVVITLFGPACRDTDAIPEPDQFKLDRPESAYIHLGYGPHACLGREIAITFISSLVKLCGSLKHLRPAPGKMGALKQIQINGDRAYLNDSWSYLTTDPTTWKVHFDGVGKGVFRAPKLAAAAASDINYNALKKQQDEFIKNKLSKLMPNGPYASQYANGTADPTKPATYSEDVGSTVPVPNGGPPTNAVDQQSSMPGYQGLPDGQPQQQPSTKENRGLLNRAIRDFGEINQKTVGTAHDLAHGFVNSVPGGSSASQLTHGIAQSFIPSSYGASGSASEQI